MERNRTNNRAQIHFNIIQILCIQVAKMSRSCCPACTSSVHLTSSSPALTAHLLEQTVCAICWRPLLLPSYYTSPTLPNLATTEVGISSTSLPSTSSSKQASQVPQPLLAACGHLFHPGAMLYFSTSIHPERYLASPPPRLPGGQGQNLLGHP